MSDERIDITSVLESKKALLQGKKSLAMDSFASIYSEKATEKASSEGVSGRNQVNVRLVADNLQADVKNEVGVKRVLEQFKNWESKRSAFKKGVNDSKSDIDSGHTPIYRQIIANSVQK